MGFWFFHFVFYFPLYRCHYRPLPVTDKRTTYFLRVLCLPVPTYLLPQQEGRRRRYVT